MDMFYIVLGILLVIVLGYGLYSLVTRGKHETDLYRPDARAKKRAGLQNAGAVIVAIVLFVAMIMVLMYLV